MAGGDEAGEAEEARMGTGDHDGVESQVGYVEQVDPRSAQPKIERSRNRTRATTGLYCNVRAQLQYTAAQKSANIHISFVEQDCPSLTNGQLKHRCHVKF